MKSFKQYITEELLTETPGPIKLWKWLQNNPPPQWWEFWRHNDWQREFDIQYLNWFESMMQYMLEHWDELSPEEQQQIWELYREYYGRPELTPPQDDKYPTSPIEHKPPSGLPPYDMEGPENTQA